nr:hypothetical protein [Tanacetum cinerariifolium]
MSRQGASYFVTFTDDFSRYGYVYLLKLKHEMFETFKVFQKEEENQLGKTIKSLRSDRGGKYMSPEFLDHLKDHGIIAHRTPPYTPQHNVDLPPNGKTVGSKWFFKKKTGMDGVIHTYKARLVVKGYTQTLWIDYEETFSSVTDIRAIRILIAIVVSYDYEIWQMDVKTAFLNGHLSEEVYIEQHEGFVNLKYPKRVCKLKRSIYGLKQASRCFAMKDLGEAAYILGIKIYRDRSRRLIGSCQSAYIDKILKRFHMESSKRKSIPMQEKLRLSKSQCASKPAELKRMQNVPYALAVGSIMYAVRCTRPDVAFAQNTTSRFQKNPGDLHWTTVKNILKYLRNIKDMFLVYGCDIKREIRVSCYTDAGYLTDADDLKSQTRYVFILNGGAVD